MCRYTMNESCFKVATQVVTNFNFVNSLVRIIKKQFILCMIIMYLGGEKKRGWHYIYYFPQHHCGFGEDKERWIHCWKGYHQVIYIVNWKISLHSSHSARVNHFAIFMFIYNI